MSKSNNIDSISTFFTISQYQYHIFDMGHKVYPLSNRRFQRIEEQKETYPTPFKQEAWLGILFWQPTKEHTPIIWFIHLPIDEMGLLKRETRDHFIQQTLQQVGEKITYEQNPTKLTEQQASSPFAFKPNQEKMAIFNALAKKILNQKPSQYYSHVVNYLEGQIGYEQWSFLGLQGIADVIVRLDTEKDLQENLAKAVPHLPDTPLITFSNMLEHAQLSPILSTALLTRLDLQTSATNQTNIMLQAALLRALSSAQSHQHRQNAIKTIIQRDTISNIEILAVIASRSWHELLDQQILRQFLEALATQSQESFNSLLLGLITLPKMQTVVRHTLKNMTEETSQQLIERTKNFMQHFSTINRQ